MKDKFIGVIVTMATSCLMFLFYSYFNSFETKASSISKYQRIDNKLDLILCYLDKKYCLGKHKE